MNEVPITAMTVGAFTDIGAEASKRRPPGSRNRYSHAVTYTLADGRTVDGRITGATRAKLADAVARQHQYIARGCLFANFYEGEYIGTVLTVRLAAGG